MKRWNTLLLAGLCALAASPATAQQGIDPGGEDDSQALPPIQHFRPIDARGINLFEPPKNDSVAYDGFKIRWGAAFTQQFQGLDHENTAAPRRVGTDTTNLNRLIDIGSGFNNAVANLYLNAQLARGIRVALTAYLSSRHHNETWIKDGYLLVDESPIDNGVLNKVMEYVTLRAGHFEINYGDAHFRRTDNGNAMYNPFVGNYIMDAFTTEIGAEAYFRTGPWLAMAGVTGGEIRGNLTQPANRSPAFLGKVGFDSQVRDNLRVRLTGSAYTVSKSPGSTLYAGDRAGSRYYMVLENPLATESGNFTSGLINPGFRRNVTSYMVNPFVKFGGLELFGLAERANGRNNIAEVGERSWNQYAGDAVYRFLDDRLYVGGRYNTVSGETVFGTGANARTLDVGADRVELGGGWFINRNIMLKGEYVRQNYNDFPETDIRNGGEFNGFVIEGTVAF